LHPCCCCCCCCVPALINNLINNLILQVITGIAYFAVAISGFYAFGTGVADNVLLSFAKGPTSWVVAMAGVQGFEA
jgi:hypothetical protein